jgi:hypothetical protein
MISNPIYPRRVVSMERSLRTVAIAVVLVSIVSISYLGLQNVLNPRVLPTIHYDEIDQGAFCGLSERSEYVVEDNESWSILWIDMHNTSSSVPQLPFVDFDYKVVIAVFIGDFPTGGYSAEIKRIVPTLFGHTVHVEERHPGEGCGLLMAITQPYQIVKANITNPLQVDFVFNVVVYDCS